MVPEAFADLVEQDIAWLKKQPRTLERDHVIEICRDYVALYREDPFWARRNQLAEDKARAATRVLERATWTMEQWHKAQSHPDWEYRCVETGRKDGQDGRPAGEGWEPNTHVVGDGYNWERFEYTENNYWMRLKKPATP